MRVEPSVPAVTETGCIQSRRTVAPRGVVQPAGPRVGVAAGWEDDEGRALGLGVARCVGAYTYVCI